ncbi:anaerobic sulfatase maturase [Streptomyces cylindrosporus]|uniref:Anaerobic sulfatase maturase n=1 Tax=Streptomyces cylindrosporus TaxID=2927583 RepID=A0ABS9Y9G0_9ACTN|nr:anaerobic sulfatase maturase [Streptomyces cylindrosporus]MCI3273870.1 anaerobic sulfatase maturase [Streptomyces cylindrosporus]
MTAVPLPTPSFPGPDAGSEPGPFHLLAKPAGAICNLDCTYCFFLSKELLYEGSRFRMADELLDRYIRQLIEAHGPAPEVTVAWQGGEPTLMGLDFFRRSLAYERRYARPGQRIVNTIQTNGTLLDAQWARFFRDNDFLVGLSVDGPRAMHDAHRVDKGGRPTFDRVMRGLRLLREHGVQWNALTTVHDANAAHGREVYAFLRDECGARHLQFIPIVERTTQQHLAAADAGWGTRAKDRPLYRQEGDRVTARSVTGEQYGRFLIDVFEDWVRRDVGTVYVQMFDVALANWYGVPPSLCVHSETCGRALALEHNGDVYSCDHFVEPAHLLGNIGQWHLLELVDSPRQREFGRAKRDALPRFCRECDVRFACHGGCPKDRFDRTPDGEPGLNHLCAGFKAFFHHVDRPMATMAALLRRGLPPALIMRRYADDDAVRPHNAPCPCGGGRKWARCHGRPAPRATDTGARAATRTG